MRGRGENERDLRETRDETVGLWGENCRAEEAKEDEAGDCGEAGVGEAGERIVLQLLGDFLEDDGARINAVADRVDEALGGDVRRESRREGDGATSQTDLSRATFCGSSSAGTFAGSIS